MYLHVLDLDLDREPRVFGCTVDRGAYEYSGNTDSSGLCLTPTAVAGGACYLSVTPADQGSTPVALLVVRDSCDSALSCTSYVQSKCVGGSNNGQNCYTDADCPKRCVGGQFPNRDCTIPTDCPQGECVGRCDAGTLGETPFFKTAAQWGTAKVRGAQIRPETTYMVHTECNFPGGAVLSTPASARTWKWGDVNNNGVVNALDVTNLVNALKGFYGPYTFEQMNLFGCTPDGVINALDIALDVDAVRGFGFPCSASCSCVDEADLRADLDGDGDIDADDDALEATGVLYFVVNSDDDNGDDIEDYLNDGPVANEDDLVEIRMSAKCRAIDPDAAWWSISWMEPDPANPALKVWLNSDKSNGQGAPGTPIAKDIQQDWPPPQSVWLEAARTLAETSVVFTTSDNSTQATAATPTATLFIIAPCSPGRHWVQAWKNRPEEGITGAGAVIQTRYTTLCGDGFLGPTTYASSNAWVGVDRDNAGKWAQVGYAHDRDEGSYVSNYWLYAEVKSGLGCELPDYQLQEFEALDPGEHEYRVELDPVLGRWRYYYDGIDLTVSNPVTWSGWTMLTGTRVQWSAELHNYEDQLVGTFNEKCRFSHCSWRVPPNDYLVDLNLSESDLRAKKAFIEGLGECPIVTIPAVDDPVGAAFDWGIQLANPVGQPPRSSDINMWDKIVP